MIDRDTGKLIQKGKKGLRFAIFSRFGIIVGLLLIQFFFLFSSMYYFEQKVPIMGGTIAFTVCMVIYLLRTNINPTGKITWLIIIMVLPIFGSLLFLYVRSDFGHRALKKRIAAINTQYKNIISQDEDVLNELKEENHGLYNLLHYLNRNTCHTVYKDSEVVYFDSGEAKYKALLEELQKAKHFILLEYYIIAEGEMWNSILRILIEKAKEGVEVYLMYDGSNELATLPFDYPKDLEKLNIKAIAFAPLRPFISTHYNYRDHRKIAVIDGRVAFNGGVNLADEYINKYERFGHWKDAAVMIKGKAVKSYTLMFFELWCIDHPKFQIEPYLKVSDLESDSQGYVIPYRDCPLDDDKTGELVYMDILNRAKEYVHIMTPYLILDGELETAIRFAAERGVEVCLLLPGIPDKKIPYALAKTHYRSLLEAGVKIYEYTPGFVHSKCFVCDGHTAVVGTINLDYRSLYHHFECATYLYQCDCVQDVENDFEKAILLSKEVHLEDLKHLSFYDRVVGSLFKAIAPLL